MLTLLLALAGEVHFGVIIGYILSGCEILIVVLTLLSFFVPRESKVGRILSFFLRGLYKSKDYLQRQEEHVGEEEVTHDPGNSESDNC